MSGIAPSHAGFGTIQIVAAVAIMGMLTALGLAAKSYIDGVDKKAYERGVNETRAAVALRDNKQLESALGKVRELEAERDKKEAEHAAELAVIDEEGLQGVRRAEAAKDAFISDVVAGRVRLFDPTRRTEQACAPSRGGEGGTSVATPGVGDGTAGGQLSTTAEVFLLGEAFRADKVVLQLTACQKIVVADRKACNAVD